MLSDSDDTQLYLNDATLSIQQSDKQNNKILKETW